MERTLSKEILFIENTPPPAMITKRCAKAKEISSNYVSALTKSRRSTLEIRMARGVMHLSEVNKKDTPDTINSKDNSQLDVLAISAEDSGHWVEVQVPQSADGKMLAGQGVRYMMYEIMPEVEAVR